jgi:hypothetical protein
MAAVTRRQTWIRALVAGVAALGFAARMAGVRVPVVFSALAEIAIVALVALGVLKVPRAVRELLRAELRLLGAVLRALLRRPLVASAITFTKESSYPSLAVALGIVILVEGGVVHLLLAAHPRGQLAVLALDVYSLLWLIGDLRALREATCHFERSAVRIELGFRGSSRIPYRLIDAVSAPEPGWTPSAKAFRLTPGDAPNLRVDLKKPIVVRGLLGIRRRAESIGLYLDDPERFRALLGIHAG